MITVSERAARQVNSLMDTEGLNNEYFIRVSVVGGGCSGLSYKMDFDNESQEGDQEFDSNGYKIVCDMKSFLYLCGTELDFTDGLNGKGFQFNNPNASRTCGCGESFSV
ncbi:MAG: iron-sulfur cluster assembly accessory protein [Bacteroidia bacterium]|nr:iron-sulfur cluster assembly accessory protein [Bacteroidia bacterium]